MGWKGAVRSLVAASRAMDREAKRRQRELERQQKEQEKMEERQRAAYEVAVYENHIELLLSVHKECSRRIDWQEIASAPEPQKPELQTVNEDKAKEKLSHYKPGFFDKLLKLEDRKRAKLKGKIETAKETDRNQYNQAVEQYKKDHAEWKESANLAKKVLNHEGKAFISALEKFKPFEEMETFGAEMKINADEKAEIMKVEIYVHADEAVPKQAKTLLSSGKLSVKDIPKSKYYELYQDYICSCVFRIANELFALLPVKTVIITATDKLLDTKTGKIEKQSILSVAVLRETVEDLNLELIDPSDAMENFIHNMDFKKTTGFSAVQQINPSDLKLDGI